ncbi:hypothetical protein F5Y18DRAFT_435750 [Xylariaceae sp. FL1019]|nr:hypothetical protein F5Y18DRAFT_435750 [Xylariaceae sp. FL1019]
MTDRYFTKQLSSQVSLLGVRESRSSNLAGQLSSRPVPLLLNGNETSGLTKQLAFQSDPLLLSENGTRVGQLPGKELRIAQRPSQRVMTRKSVDLFGFGTFIHSSRTEVAPWKQSNVTDEAGTGATHEEWRFLPSTWTRIKAINILRSRSLGNWQYSFSSFHVVEWESSPIMIACRAGDINQVIQLLTTGEATMSDVDQYGLTLLHKRHRTPLDYCLEAVTNIDMCLDTMRMLLDDKIPDMMFDDDLDGLRQSFRYCSAPPEALTYLSAFMPGDDLDVMYTEAWQEGRCQGQYSPMNAKAAFGRVPNWPKRATEVPATSRTGRSILHAVAINLLLSFHRNTDESDVTDILEQILATRHGIDLHPHDAYGATPFDYLLGTHICQGYRHCEVNSYQNYRAVSIWLHALHNAGFDVRQYIETEQDLHKNGVLVTPRVRSRVRRLGVERHFTYRPCGNAFGVCLSVTDVRVQQLNVPGTWPEMDDDDDGVPLIDGYDGVENWADWSLIFDPTM